MKISIVIPNFNGEKLLEKNLPNILESGADEVIVCDDGSSDGSLEVLNKFQITNNKLFQKKLPSAEQTNSKLKILKHEKNKGFIRSVNELFYKASCELLVLLNNDVYVERNFLKPLTKHFENPKVFAVNLHEKCEGPAVSFWKDGFYEFERGEESGNIQKSAWASGGSAVFKKSIWDELGGFDEFFAPFYWEDIDISYGAIKAGYEILWEPKSIVKHNHETTIKKTFNERYVRWVQQRNQLLFIWKNISDPKLKSEHRKGLFKRLFSSELGYWIPFFWALIVILGRSKAMTPESISEDSGPFDGIQGKQARMIDVKRRDLEVINYAG